MPICSRMKLIMLLFAFAFQNTVSVVDRIPFSEQRGDSCDPEETARQISLGRKLPRSVLFHYGRKEILIKNVNAGTIPQEDWDQFIMGNKTRFHLKRFRRGLYGTEYLESADRFASSTYDWLIEIHLNESCLEPNRIATVNGLTRAVLFKNWFEAKNLGMTLQEWTSKCFHRNGEPNESLFGFYSKEKNSQADQSDPETICEKVVGDFFDEKNFSLIQDHAGDLTSSWAVRDRNCIRDILGSPAYWAHEFSHREELWKNHCPQNRNRNHRNNIRVWFSAMAEAGYRIQDLEHFSHMIRVLKKPEPKLIDRALDEYDEFAAQDFADTLELVARRCERAGKKKQFLSVLGGIAKNVGSNKDYDVNIQSSDLKFTLESACR